MSYLANAQKLRTAIIEAATLLTDEQALTVPEIYPAWSGDGVTYATGERVTYGGTLYKCLQSHSSQSTWTPTDAPSLWATVLIPDSSTVSEWEQSDSTNAYSKGDKVMHNGKQWMSEVDDNVWEPGVYGWTEVSTWA